ncbi:MAG: excinuclease ABC subunit A, partial [Myxococcales bacterium]|nr:excinuclease ABC subunit A [Myxococcales bacterium]
AQRSGIERALVDGKWIQTDTPPKLSRSKEHDIDLLLGSQLSAKDVTPELLRLALRWGKGAVRLLFASGEARLISQNSACPTCGLSVPELDPRFFSFNTKQGRCETCEGDGVLSEVRKVGRGKQARSEEVISECPECAGERLGPVPRSVRFSANGSGGVRYPELMNLSVRRAVAEVRTWKLSGDRARIGDAVVQELERRLSFLEEVGLDYLSLDRGARSLSGGEMQRLRLAAQLGSGLTGALYVLDEPTIGLHPRDTSRLVGNLKRLVEQGSTVLVVEHDEDTIRAADYLVDVGPGGGSHGGNIVAVGAPEHVLQQVDSPTAQSLREPPQLRQSIPVEMGAKDHKGKAPAKGKAKKDVSPAGAERTAADQQWLELLGASEHNLKAVDLKLPIGRLSVIAGVSGSGKSTLVRQVLLPALRQKLGLVAETPGAFKKLGDTGTLQRAISVDQSPIGRTPRSVPATFLGIFDDLRRLYAATPEAKVRGFDASRFSFNTPRGGRCTTCDGQGAITHEMSFLPDVITTCPACDGQRFEPSTLEIRYRDLSIGDVLNLSAEQAVAAFENHPRIIQPLRTLVDLGAGYVRLGQGSHTLSGGEAQRLKLAAELTEGARHQPTLYVLDEPTTGLHLRDVGRLVQVLGRLVERGDTLVVIEHHPHVIASADWIVELGPEGGEAGGELVAQGTPAQLRKRKTATGRVLAELLGR